MTLEFPTHFNRLQESQYSNGSTIRGCLPRAVTRPSPTQRKTMIEIGTVKQSSVYHFLRHCPYFCYGFPSAFAKEVKPAKSPWESGRGTRQRRGGRNGTQITLKISPQPPFCAISILSLRVSIGMHPSGLLPMKIHGRKVTLCLIPESLIFSTEWKVNATTLSQSPSF